MRPWIGVDLDGTLAVHEPGADIYPIGEPVPRMARRIEPWIEKGVDVKIMTARVGPQPSGGEIADVNEARYEIEKWCQTNLGLILPVTCTKDFMMLELWDDRAVQVERNTGRRFRPPE